jgi:ketosteroid isomerase-like protein
MSEDAEIRRIIYDVAEAVRARKVDAFLAHCAPEIAIFDLVPPLTHRGESAVRRSWAIGLGQFDGRARYDIEHLTITVADNVAFSHSLNVLGGTLTSGTQIRSRVRTTFGFRRVGGAWKIVHQHVSAPLDLTTGRAMLDLKA